MNYDSPAPACSKFHRKKLGAGPVSAATVDSASRLAFGSLHVQLMGLACSFNCCQ